ncbi:hypothetical protein ACWGNE_29040, partial [Streptomyces xiamenensis]
MVQNIRVIGTGQLLELSARLRRAGHENIRSSFHRRIRRAAAGGDDGASGGAGGDGVRPARADGPDGG